MNEFGAQNGFISNDGGKSVPFRIQTIAEYIVQVLFEDVVGHFVSVKYSKSSPALRFVLIQTT